MVEKSTDMRRELHEAYSRMVLGLDIKEDNRVALDAIIDHIESVSIEQKRIGALSLNHFFSSCAIYVLASESIEGKLSSDKFYSSYSEIIITGNAYNAILERHDECEVYRMARDNLLMWEKLLSDDAGLRGALMHSRSEMNEAILEALKMANPLEYHRVFLFGRKYSGLLGGKVDEGEAEKAGSPEENGIRRAAAGLAYISQNGYGLGAFHSGVLKMACEYLVELDREAPYRAAELLQAESELGKKLMRRIYLIEAGAEKLSGIFFSMANGGKTDAEAKAGSTLHAMDLMDSVIEAFGLLDKAKAEASSKKLRR